jgi:hypothetical protein
MAKELLEPGVDVQNEVKSSSIQQNVFDQQIICQNDDNHAQDKYPWEDEPPMAQRQYENKGERMRYRLDIFPGKSFLYGCFLNICAQLSIENE